MGPTDAPPTRLHLRAAILIIGLTGACWFPGNPTGRSSNHETSSCPSTFPVGKPCDPDKLSVCRDRGEQYECVDKQWHNR